MTVCGCVDNVARITEFTGTVVASCGAIIVRLEWLKTVKELIESVSLGEKATNGRFCAYIFLKTLPPFHKIDAAVCISIEKQFCTYTFRTYFTELITQLDHVLTVLRDHRPGQKHW